MVIYYRICPKGKTWYLIKWIGNEESTWTFYKDVDDGCPDIMRQFLKE
jgi:hypothetical protein